MSRPSSFGFSRQFLRNWSRKRSSDQQSNYSKINSLISKFTRKGGELLSNRPEDQEIALLSLHLIQVSLALVNTLMLQEVLAEGKWNAAMKQEDWRGLTPLFYQHVNPYGRFTLDLTQRIPLSLTKLA